MTYANWWSDWMIRTYNIVKRILTRFEIRAQKPHLKWVPDMWQDEYVDILKTTKLYFRPYENGHQIDGLVQERCNSIANAMELHLSCTNPLKYWNNTLLMQYTVPLRCYMELLWKSYHHRFKNHVHLNSQASICLKKMNFWGQALRVKTIDFYVEKSGGWYAGECWKINGYFTIITVIPFSSTMTILRHRQNIGTDIFMRSHISSCMKTHAHNWR